ncbi:MAG: terminase, partial [Chloroflexi bacterium]
MMNDVLERLRPSLKPSDWDCILAILEGKALWAPQSRPQWQALLTQADELFYGGQAGGGKTHLLLGLAAVAHRRSIIFRREFTQLTGAEGVIEKSREILGGMAHYNGQEHVWRDIPGDRILEFAGVQQEADKHKFQGRAHDLKAFDEVTEFTEGQYRFLTGWARSTTPGQRVRVVATGNPPSHSDGRWVINYWAPWLDDRHPNPARPGELRWFAVLDGKDKEVGPEPFDYNGERILPKSRTFIPAALADNPFLRDSGYGAVLQG